MTTRVTLELPDELAREIEREYQNRKESLVESYRRSGWDKQAEQLEAALGSSDESNLAAMVLDLILADSVDFDQDGDIVSKGGN